MNISFDIATLARCASRYPIWLLLAASIADTSLAAPPLVKLANGPIVGTPVHPNTILDLSVEFPTAGAAYRKPLYDATRRYTGNFDSSQCYVYTKPTTYSGGNYDASQDDLKYFTPGFSADAGYKCRGAGFSGNFMNWAASSAMDVMRATLSGGDRIIDNVGKTILQRAVLGDLLYASKYYMPIKTLATSGAIKPSDVTPFTNPTIYAVSCNNRILFSSAPPKPRGLTTGNPTDTDYALCNAQANPDKNLGEYVVRVEVCSDKEGPTRPGYCTRYGSHYKPEGLLQQNADNMHFAAFGYILDSDQKRYGGTLRAPMKYIGPNKFDVMLNKSPNAATEWDPNTGIFLPDPSPDGSNPGASGVINYLNKFGRTGKYKFTDPLGELYYESLRYLQGLQPTPEATAGVTPEMKDGFPVITNWIDPITTSCQKNSIIMVADANADYDYYIPGNTRSVTHSLDPGDPASLSMNGTIADGPRASIPDSATIPGLNVMEWARKIGQIESSTHGVDSRSRPQLAGAENQKTGWLAFDNDYKGTYYLSALAYWANVTDLRKDKKGIRAKTYVIDVDEIGNGVLDDSNTRNSARPRDSQLYLAAKYGRFDSEPDGVHREDPYWPIPTAGSPKSANGCYSYLWDPNANCDPENYFLGSDGVELANGINQIFNEIAAQGEAVAQVGVSSAVVMEDTRQYIYQGKFNSNAWSGDVRRLPVDYSPATGLKIGAPDLNSPTLNLREPDWPVPAAGAAVPPRKIFTYRGGSLPIDSTIPFEWAQLDATQQGWLNSTDAQGEARLHYLRGATSGETRSGNGGSFRPRAKAANQLTNLLGDIVHSNPVFVGAPASDIQGDGYPAFATSRKDRARAVYVGANDGMLHAFSPDLTTEYFAYIPKMVFPDLQLLTHPEYTHHAYVDGAIAVSEAKVGSQWKTVLASTMGAGAQGVFALDVTDPANFDAKNGALWEFSDADDPDMGNVFGAPVIAKFVKGQSGGQPVYEYFVVVTSGVNNYAADKAVAKPPGESGALFLLSLNKKSNVAWTQDVNYYKFSIPIAAVDKKLPTGLSAPALAIRSDGSARFAYAGDLQGNLWRFEFGTDRIVQNAVPHKLFVAKDASGVPQPITAQPKIVYALENGLVVLFGTGKYLDNTDVVTKSANSFYAIYDTLGATDFVTGRSQLQARTLSGSPDAAQLTLTGAAFSYAGPAAKKGWYFDFPNTAVTGERSVTPALLNYGRVFFNTLLPPNDACTPTSKGRTYTVNTLTGLADGGTNGSTGALSAVGALSTPVAFDTLAKVQATAIPNAIGRKVVQRGYSIAGIGSKGVATSANRKVDLPAGRLGWLEIFNYEEKRNAVPR